MGVLRSVGSGKEEIVKWQFQEVQVISDISNPSVIDSCVSDEATYAEASCDSLGGTYNETTQRCEQIVISPEGTNPPQDNQNSIILNNSNKFAIIADGNFGVARHSIFCGNLAVGVQRTGQEDEFADYFGTDASFPNINCGQSTPNLSGGNNNEILRDMGNMVVGNNLDVKMVTAEKVKNKLTSWYLRQQ